jgi:hypothetical protein
MPNPLSWATRPEWLIVVGVAMLGLALWDGTPTGRPVVPLGVFILAKGAEEMARPRAPRLANVLLTVSLLAFLASIVAGAVVFWGGVWPGPDRATEAPPPPP